MNTTVQALRIVSRKWIGASGGYPVEPVDLHPSIRHLDCLYDKLTLTDKVPHACALGTARVGGVMEDLGPDGALLRAALARVQRLRRELPRRAGCVGERVEERGAIDTPRRANAIWKKILAEFEAPPMDEAIREELAAFVERRKREGGAPTDF